MTETQHVCDWCGYNERLMIISLGATETILCKSCRKVFMKAYREALGRFYFTEYGRYIGGTYNGI